MPLARMQATPAIDMREKRAPIEPPGGAVPHARQRQQEARNAADPDGGAELMQELDGKQRRTVIEPRGRVGRQRRRCELDKGRAQASGTGVRPAAAARAERERE